jgi:hypothetical protein
MVKEAENGFLKSAGSLGVTEMRGISTESVQSAKATAKSAETLPQNRWSRLFPAWVCRGFCCGFGLGDFGALFDIVFLTLKNVTQKR